MSLVACPRPRLLGGARVRTAAGLALIAIAARTVSFLMLWIAHAGVDAGWWESQHVGASGSWTDFLSLWDGHAYGVIAERGYPTTLRTDDEGLVEQNEWAFLPLYPMLVRGVVSTIDVGVATAGVLVSSCCAITAVLALHAVLVRTVDEQIAWRGAVLFAFTPLGFVLNVTYAESLFLTLVFTSIALLVRGRIVALLPFAVLAAFTRPGALLIPAALGVVFVVDLLRRRLRLRRAISLLVVGAVTAAAGLAWPVIAAWGTGRPDAYVQTELAWWREIVGDVSFVPMTPWPILAVTFGGPAGVVLLVVIVAASVWALARWARNTALPVPAAVLSYSAYVLAVFLPQQSLFRILMPMAPVLATQVCTATRRRFVVALAVSVALQPVAIGALWLTWPP